MGIVDRYYADQLSNGTNKYEVNESIKEMSKVRTIIDNDSRLNLIVDHFISHYENRVKEGATVKGKAMFVCYDRNIAYKSIRKSSLGDLSGTFLRKHRKMNPSLLTVN